MKRGSAIVLLTLSALLAGARQSAPPKPDVVVTGRYEEDSVRIEGAGVCSITSDRVDCWDIAGVRNEDLTEQIRIHHLTHDRDLNFRFGQKNRYLVIRRSPVSANVQYQTPTGEYIYMQNRSASSDGFVLEWGRVAVDPAAKAKEMAITAALSVPGPKPLDIPFRTGERRTYAGTEIEIGRWKPFEAEKSKVRTPNQSYPGRPEGKLWSVVLGVEPSPGNPGHVGFWPLFRNGKPIRYVDRKGEPVTDIEYLHSLPARREYGFNPEPRPEAKYVQAQFNSTGNGIENAITVTTNINPARIAFLRAGRTDQKRVLIQGFPLDPKD